MWLGYRRQDRLSHRQNRLRGAVSSRHPCRCGAAREAPWQVAVSRSDRRQQGAFSPDAARRPLAAPMLTARVSLAPQQIDLCRLAKDRSLSHFTRQLCEIVHSSSLAGLRSIPRITERCTRPCLFPRAPIPDPSEQSLSPAPALAPYLPAGWLFSVQAPPCTHRPRAWCP
jgi:hypothetical protein